MSLSERTGLNVESIKAEIVALQTEYQATRKNAMKTLAGPYRRQLIKLRRVLAALEGETTDGRPVTISMLETTKEPAARAQKGGKK